MKISQSLLFAYASAQGDDRWGSTDYYSFNYGFGGKQDGGVAFGMTDNTTLTNLPATHGLEELYGHNTASAHYMDNLHYNGLLCWMCDFRLDLATEAEQTTCNTTTCQNAYARCLKYGMLMRCRGEQRTCMFEERRRHGVVYSVTTGCKQTDACVAHWRRNQRFTLPFMNFGDMSLRNLPTSTSNALVDSMDQLPNHRPVYVDDECSTYQETRTEAAWRANHASDTVGTNSEVYPMGWKATSGKPFTSDGTNLQFTGHRVNLGLSYSKFAYDGANNLQLNAQLSQWESTCRWCCHARPDTVCNIQMSHINSSPFATKCGNSVGTRRDQAVTVTGSNSGTYQPHSIAALLADLSTRITDNNTAYDSSTTQQSGYWNLLQTQHADYLTTTIRAIDYDTLSQNQCSLSNAQWSTSATASEVTENAVNYPAGINLKFRFFQPFNIAQSHADYWNAEALTCHGGTAVGVTCTAANAGTVCAGGGNCLAGAYQQGPRFWMQMFQRTPQYDISAWYGDGTVFTAKFPAVGEGRNCAGMDKYAGRGNKSRSNIPEAQLRGNTELQHFFQQQTDMVSQENRDFFDSRATDAQTSLLNSGMYLKRYDNPTFWNSP